MSINRNKRSIAINMKAPEGIDVVRQLVEQSDVLVENFLPGTLERMGLGWDTLQAINPRLVYATITGYGPTGP